MNNITIVTNRSVDYVNVTLPAHLTFTKHSLVIVILYCIVFVIAAVGNLTVFITLSREKLRKSRMSLMICHLSAADLLVAFFMIPIEIAWRITVQWMMGNYACKIFVFFRAFGFYLSNNILVCVSLDRYFAILHPLSVNDARRRGKLMLLIAWIVSFIYAAPQSFIFHVSTHPVYKNFTQCVTFGSFLSNVDETIYNVFCVLAMYLIPLIIICCVYTRILCEISSKTRESKQVLMRTHSTGIFDSTVHSNKGSKVRLRRSDMSNIERALSRTLKMTITIVAVFIICWTPYFIMLLWYIFDGKSASQVEQSVQEVLFMMAVGNSCANPLVYGTYAVDFKKQCCRCFSQYKTKKTKNSIKLERRSTGTTVLNQDKSPGVSILIVRSVRNTFHGLFKAGGRQTTSTVIGGTAVLRTPSHSPRLANMSIPRTYDKLPLCEMQLINQDNNMKLPYCQPMHVTMYQNVNECQST